MNSFEISTKMDNVGSFGCSIGGHTSYLSCWLSLVTWHYQSLLGHVWSQIWLDSVIFPSR
jgi:hypothetical protein